MCLLLSPDPPTHVLTHILNRSIYLSIHKLIYQINLFICLSTLQSLPYSNSLSVSSFLNQPRVLVNEKLFLDFDFPYLHSFCLPASQLPLFAHHGARRSKLRPSLKSNLLFIPLSPVDPQSVWKLKLDVSILFGVPGRSGG